MQTLSKMAKIPKSKSNWDNAGVVFIQKAITVCDSNWQDGNKTQKGKKYVFKTFVNKCHENWKKSKNYLLIVLSPAKQKIKSQDLFKKHQNWSKTDQNWSETWSKLIQKLMSSQSLFCLFSSLRKIMHFYKSFLWSQKIILESRKRTSWSPINN